jgi:hypothetical protein
MYDNKIRLSQDVLEKAELIAAEWGLKNARAAIEAVFRRYCDDYLYGRSPSTKDRSTNISALSLQRPAEQNSQQAECEALSELDDLLFG